MLYPVHVTKILFVLRKIIDYEDKNNIDNSPKKKFIIIMKLNLIR